MTGFLFWLPLICPLYRAIARLGRGCIAYKVNAEVAEKSGSGSTIRMVCHSLGMLQFITLGVLGRLRMKVFRWFETRLVSQ